VFSGDFFLKIRRILSYLTNFKVKIYENKFESKPPNLLKWFLEMPLCQHSLILTDFTQKSLKLKKKMVESNLVSWRFALCFAQINKKEKNEDHR